MPVENTSLIQTLIGLAQEVQSAKRRKSQNWALRVKALIDQAEEAVLDDVVRHLKIVHSLFLAPPYQIDDAVYQIGEARERVFEKTRERIDDLLRDVATTETTNTDRLRAIVSDGDSIFHAIGEDKARKKLHGLLEKEASQLTPTEIVSTISLAMNEVSSQYITSIPEALQDDSGSGGRNVNLRGGEVALEEFDLPSWVAKDYDHGAHADLEELGAQHLVSDFIDDGEEEVSDDVIVPKLPTKPKTVRVPDRTPFSVYRKNHLVVVADIGEIARLAIKGRILTNDTIENDDGFGRYANEVEQLAPFVVTILNAAQTEPTAPQRAAGPKAQLALSLIQGSNIPVGIPGALIEGDEVDEEEEAKAALDDAPWFHSDDTETETIPERVHAPVYNDVRPRERTLEVIAILIAIGVPSIIVLCSVGVFGAAMLLDQSVAPPTLMPIPVAPILADRDMDGYDEDIDCDDWDAYAYPFAFEFWNGIDANCDGIFPLRLSTKEEIETWKKAQKEKNTATRDPILERKAKLYNAYQKWKKAKSKAP